MFSVDQQIWLLTYVPGILFSLMLGFGFGSYATMAVYRLPREEPWIGLPPRCLSCETRLLLKDFFPLFSWLRHRGKCAYCGAPITFKLLYLMVELTCIVASVACFLHFGFGEMYLMAMALSLGLIITAAMDLDKRVIPNVTLWILLVISMMYRVFLDGEIFHLLLSGSLSAFLAMGCRTAFYMLTGRKEIAFDYLEFGTHDRFSGPGFSYVKLVGIMGIWVGVDAFVWVFGLSALALGLMLPWRNQLAQHSLLPISIPLILVWIFVLFT